MDTNKLHEWEKKYEDEFVKFENIPFDQRKHFRPDICGMLLLSEITNYKGDIVGSAAHDQIWFSWDSYNDNITEEQFLYLHRCGIFFDTEHDCFSSFV